MSERLCEFMAGHPEFGDAEVKMQYVILPKKKGKVDIDTAAGYPRQEADQTGRPAGPRNSSRLGLLSPVRPGVTMWRAISPAGKCGQG